MYRKIVNPETGRKVNVDGAIGKRVLLNYLNLIGGSDQQSQNDNNDSDDDQEVFNPWGSDESVSEDEQDQDSDDDNQSNEAIFTGGLE